MEENPTTIDLFRAVEQMRDISRLGETFSLKFRTYNRQTGRGGRLVEIKNARVRPAARDEEINAASYKLFFTDTDTNQPMVCWQPLIVEFNGMLTTL